MDQSQMPPDWPHRDAGKRIRSRPHDWWVIDTGTGPTLVLLHGAGGSGHSFRHLIPLLSPHYRLIVPDLPGQGFTRPGSRSRFGLDTMAEDLVTLCTAMEIEPVAVIGHSAGAAIALRMAEFLPLRAVVGINAALSTFDGVAGVMFPMLARVLAVTPFIPHVVARLWGKPATVNKLLASNGSPLDAAGQAQYLTLVRDPGHVDGTLGMMAQWKLDDLTARLPQSRTPTLLIAASGDTAVPARVSRDMAARMPTARYAEIAGFGHLVQEEAAETVADLILPFLAEYTGP